MRQHILCLGMLTLCVLSAALSLQGQTYDALAIRRDMVAPLSLVETELEQLQRTIAQEPAPQKRRQLAEVFRQRLSVLLKRSDSFNHRFAGLRHVTIITPRDSSFRVFSWVVDEPQSGAKPPRPRHYGVIQEREINARAGRAFYQVTPLEISTETRIAQDPERQLYYQSAPLSAIDRELSVLSHLVLRHDSTAYKIELNDELIRRLEIVLRREDSYDYNFAKTATMSRVFPEDHAFRLFSWTLVERNTMGRQNHYFGYVQRRLADKVTRKARILLTRLHDRMDKSEDVERNLLTPETWLGALYYQPRNTPFGVLTYKGELKTQNAMTGKKERKKVTYYVMLGYNEHNEGSNYKIIETVSFDPLDTSKITFGAPLFYYGNTLLTRKVFKYSDNSPFTLNYNQVVTKHSLGLFPKKETMLVFEHLNRPENVPPTVQWNVGGDGTYDGFHYFNKWWQGRRGFFYFMRNVSVYWSDIEAHKPGDIKKQVREQKREQKRRLRDGRRTEGSLSIQSGS